MSTGLASRTSDSYDGGGDCSGRGEGGGRSSLHRLGSSRSVYDDRNVRRVRVAVGVVGTGDYVDWSRSDSGGSDGSERSGAVGSSGAGSEVGSGVAAGGSRSIRASSSVNVVAVNRTNEKNQRLLFAILEGKRRRRLQYQGPV